MSVVVVMSP